MNKIILIYLALSTLLFAADQCYILTESTIGTYSQDTLTKIQSNKGLTDDAVKNNLAVELKTGTQFCDTSDHNWNWYRKRIQLKTNGAFLWIVDTVKADKI